MSRGGEAGEAREIPGRADQADLNLTIARMVGRHMRQAHERGNACETWKVKAGDGGEERIGHGVEMFHLLSQTSEIVVSLSEVHMAKIEIEISDDVKEILEEIRAAKGAVSIERIAEEIVRDTAVASKDAKTSTSKDAVERIIGTINALSKQL